MASDQSHHVSVVRPVVTVLNTRSTSSLKRRAIHHILLAITRSWLIQSAIVEGGRTCTSRQRCQFQLDHCDNHYDGLGRGACETAAGLPLQSDLAHVSLTQARCYCRAVNTSCCPSACWHHDTRLLVVLRPKNNSTHDRLDHSSREMFHQHSKHFYHDCKALCRIPF
jgi:hypothetical protein